MKANVPVIAFIVLSSFFLSARAQDWTIKYRDLGDQSSKGANTFSFTSEVSVSKTDTSALAISARDEVSSPNIAASSVGTVSESLMHSNVTVSSLDNGNPPNIAGSSLGTLSESVMHSNLTATPFESGNPPNIAGSSMGRVPTASPK